MQEVRRQRHYNDENISEGTNKKSGGKVKFSQVVTMVITLIIAVFVVIQVAHMVNYTLGNEMDVNKMWLYKWFLTITQK